jgi:hypothetical protein
MRIWIALVVASCSSDPVPVPVPVPVPALEQPTPHPEPAPPPPPPASLPPDATTIVAFGAAQAPRLDGLLDDPAWRAATPVPITTDWRGRPSTLETIARLTWAPDALFFSFDCAYDELAIDEGAPTTAEHAELYRFDAVEVFLDPDPTTPATYLELEVGPRGHFLDTDVDRDRRPRGDVAWSSGMRIGTSIDPTVHRYRVEVRLPVGALGQVLLVPGVLRVGLFRLAGRGDGRQYLARFPTMTDRPSFHVPERFGTLELRP